MTPLRVAILGGGMIAEVHRRAARTAGGDIAAVMIPNSESSARTAESWSVPNAYTSLEEVLESDVSVVHICTPNAFHVPYAVALLEAGKHVICEKPLGMSLDDAHRAAEAAASSGLVATVPFVYRFHPMVREMRARVQDPQFGAVNLIHGSYLQDWMLNPLATSWRVDPDKGGPSRAFGDIGSHWCDLAEWISGERITSLVATTFIAVPERPGSTAASFSGADAEGPLVPVTTEDVAVILFRTERGIPGSATISQVAAGRKNRLWLEVDGGQLSATFDQENPEQLWIGAEDAATLIRRDPNHGSTEQRRLSILPAGHAQGYAQCFEHLVADTYTAVRAQTQGTAAPEGLPTFADGLRAAQICDAMLQSAATGLWTQVAPAQTPASDKQQ